MAESKTDGALLNICPFTLSASPARCRGSECTLWICNECAIRMIARNTLELVQASKQIKERVRLL